MSILLKRNMIDKTTKLLKRNIIDETTELLKRIKEKTHVPACLSEPSIG